MARLCYYFLLIFTLFSLCFSLRTPTPPLKGLTNKSPRKGYKDMGLSFNETMTGYGVPGNLPYDVAYNQGQQSNSIFQIALEVMIPSMSQFVSDINHTAPSFGTIIVNGLTPPEGVYSDAGTFIRIFDGGIENHTLELHYFVPFTGVDGKKYSLQGVKYVYGDNCIHFLTEATTLYVHIRTGQTIGFGDIVQTGIVIIDDLGVVALALSFRFIGNGTDADRLNCMVSFADFLVGDVWQDCFNISDYESDFWYSWASDGKNGFLMDLIKRPDELELRLEIYNSSTTPSVNKQYLSLDQFSDNGTIVTMGPMTISPTSVQGTVNNIPINVIFSLSSRQMKFCPAWIESLLNGAIPDVESTYGTLVKGFVGPVTYQNLPIAYTTYPVKIGLSLLQWAMISALNFVGTDLQVEMVATYLVDLWLSSVYIHYQGADYYLNEPFLFESSVDHTGEIQNDVRLFGVQISTFSISGSVECSAPVSQFALLEKEGTTQIMTTVFGTCVAVINGNTYKTGPTALLETKFYSS